MTVGSADWEVRLTAGADLDLGEIVAWTEEQFGARQADIYEGTLGSAIEALREGPAVLGARMRPELGSAVFVLHCARNGRKARHFLVCRVSEVADSRHIEVLRILHDSMDLLRHLTQSPHRD